MKIVLTGATGFVGAEVLQQCLANPAISSIVSLSRRPLDSVSDPKLKVVVLKDFTVYDGEVMKELEGAEACIWWVLVSYSIDRIYRSLLLLDCEGFGNCYISRCAC